MNGRGFRRLSLDGSYDALLRIGDCQREMGWRVFACLAFGPSAG